MLTIGSLFSGIGGLELGLEWAGLGPVLWQVEKDEFCRRVLAKHWPDVPRWNDVETVRGKQLPVVDLICGGFPCQDVSSAGKRAGLSGKRSGLWWNFARIVADARPEWVVVENVASGASRWLCPVRSHLRELGYRSRALGIAARDVGAPHRRSRVFVLAHSDQVAPGQQGRGGRPSGRPANLPAHDGGSQHVADPASSRRARGLRNGQEHAGRSRPENRTWWAIEPHVGRVAHGVSQRMDRLAGLGNAVVPQCAQVVGEVIRQMLAEALAPRVPGRGA